MHGRIDFTVPGGGVSDRTSVGSFEDEVNDEGRIKRMLRKRSKEAMI